MIVSKSNDKFQNSILWMIWGVLVFFIFKTNILVGIAIIVLTIYLYSKLVYKVIFQKGYFEIKYLKKLIIINYQDILYVQILHVRPSLGLNLSLVTNTKKKRYNFSYGDTENLILMLNYFTENKIKILDEGKLLNSYVKFEDNSYK